MIFNSSPAPAAYRTDATGPLFVSFLHMGGTVPAGSDPIPGKQETAFCFTSTVS